ncbi:hypothetical protein BU14_2730s0001, partial [Porphyra umbilicalis]
RAVPRVGASAPTAGAVGLTCEPVLRPWVWLRACGVAPFSPARRAGGCWVPLGFPLPLCAHSPCRPRCAGLAGVLSGVAVGASMVRRTGAIFPLATVGALLGGLTGNLFADHVASWVLGTYKYDPVATREALAAFAVRRHPPGSPPPPST